MPHSPSSKIISSENTARDFLRKARILSPPTNVDTLCKIAAITLMKEDLDDELSGMSFVKNDRRYIIVNKNHHVNRRRFTIAHEIGHHFLHADYLKNNVHVDTLVLNRDSMSANGMNQKEIEANAFAAELLMPMAQMKKYSTIDLAQDDATIREAAKLFKVSASAFTYRLLNLGGRLGY